MAATIRFALSRTRRLLSPRVSWLTKAPWASSKSISLMAFQMVWIASGGRGIYHIHLTRQYGLAVTWMIVRRNDVKGKTGERE